MEDNAIGILLVSIIGLAIWAFVLNLIIQNATKAKELKRSSEIQVRLLMKIAEKQGVSQEDIKQCVQQSPAK